MAKKGGGRTKGPDRGRGDVKRLRKLIKNTRTAMLTTVAADGTLRSRPMATLKARFEGDLWFVTRASAPKADEIKDNQNVNLAYSSPDDERFVSVTGTASLVRDPAKLQEMWSGRLKEWFPHGKKDPDLALIRVRVQQAEFWDPKTGKMVRLQDVGQAAAAAPSAASTVTAGA